MKKSEISIPVKEDEFTVLYSLKKSSMEIKIRMLRILIFLLLFLWCTGFSIVSLFPENQTIKAFYPLLKKMYSGFCHQDHEKSFYTGEYFLVCARCTGIYSGAAVAAFVLIFISPQKKRHLRIKTGSIFLIPMLCDLVFHNLGLYKYSPAAALYTGIIFGSAVIIFILSLIENNFFYNSEGPY